MFSLQRLASHLIVSNLFELISAWGSLMLHGWKTKNHTTFTLRPHYPEDIWKRSSISTVNPTVHNKPSRERSFSKTPFQAEEFENGGVSFLCARKTFWKQSVLKTTALRESCEFPCFFFFFKRKTKITLIATFLNSSCVREAFSEWNLRCQMWTRPQIYPLNN